MDGIKTLNDIAPVKRSTFVTSMNGKSDAVQKLDDDAWDTAVRSSGMEIDETKLPAETPLISILNILIITALGVVGILIIALAVFLV